jgi:hypothetical protein
MTEMADCDNLLDKLLLVHSREEWDTLIDCSQACFTWTFLYSSAKEKESRLEIGEANVSYVWLVPEYALNRVDQLLLREELITLKAGAKSVRQMHPQSPCSCEYSSWLSGKGLAKLASIRVKWQRLRYNSSTCIGRI